MYITVKTIPASKPDIVLHVIKYKKALLVSISHPIDHYLIKFKGENNSPLSIEHKTFKTLQYVKVIRLILTSTGLVNND